jgi:hypothetical protein
LDNHQGRLSRRPAHLRPLPGPQWTGFGSLGGLRQINRRASCLDISPDFPSEAAGEAGTSAPWAGGHPARRVGELARPRAASGSHSEGKTEGTARRTQRSRPAGGYPFASPAASYPQRYAQFAWEPGRPSRSHLHVGDSSEADSANELAIPVEKITGPPIIF